jgi:hypothetical protein
MEEGHAFVRPLCRAPGVAAAPLLTRRFGGEVESSSGKFALPWFRQ